MLVTFQCDAYARITMFGDVALCLLHMMGHSGTVPGAILAEDVPAARDALQKALSVSSDHAQDSDKVSLRHRALPLLDLLDAAIQHSCHVMWDV